MTLERTNLKYAVVFVEATSIGDTVGILDPYAGKERDSEKWLIIMAKDVMLLKAGRISRSWVF